MHNNASRVISEWFEGLNTTDLPRLIALFAPAPRIRNAANPPIAGPDAANKLLSEFFARTTSRHFEVVDWAAEGGQVFAYWTGTLTFPEGLKIADMVLPHELSVPLRGVERFKLDNSGKIVELDIIHETTSLLQAARAAASSAKKE